MNDLIKPIDTEDRVNLLKVLREKGPLTSEELAESVDQSLERVVYNLSEIGSAPNLELSGEWVERDSGKGKVYSVNPDVADSYLEAVEYLRKLFSK